MKTAPVALDAVAPGLLMRVENLQVTYALGGTQRMRAVDGVSFDIARGETLALGVSRAAASRRWPVR